MNLTELKKRASAILAINESDGDGFSAIEFSTRSGTLRNNLGIPEMFRNSEFAYNTVRHGEAYRTSMSIMAKKTGIMDKDNNDIYLIPDGTTFIYDYHSGSPEYFDDGEIKSPNL